MTTTLFTLAVIFVTTFAGVYNLRRTYRRIEDRKPVGWVYVTYQVVVALILVCAWLWWLALSVLAIGAVTWIVCVPIHIRRATETARQRDQCGEPPDRSLSRPTDS